MMTILNTATLLIDTVIITKITATIFQTLVLAGIADSRLHFNPGVCCSRSSECQPAEARNPLTTAHCREVRAHEAC